MATPPQGPALLAQFLEKHGLTQRDVARAVGVSDPTVHDWISGSRRPRAAHRKAISVWTRRGVPEQSWDDETEAARIAGIKPFRPRRRASGGSR